ncbi:MAG TPA: twin-arginine translocase subunit TatC [Coriobacteriia bacterium]
MPVGPQKMPFLSHLAEMRQRILVIAVAVGLGAVVAYVFTPSILSWLFEPIMPYLPGKSIYLLGPFEAFTFRFKVATYAALVLTSPVWLYQVLAFFLPALKEKERKFFFPTFLAILVLFLAGNLFCHYVVLKPSFEWLLAQTKGGVDLVTLFNLWLHKGSIPAGSVSVSLSVLPNAQQFLGGMTILMLAFGIIFELPVMLFFLIYTGVLKYGQLRRNWRYSYLVLIGFATLSTPDWSPVTMGSLFVAVVVLYEATLALARVTLRRRIQEQALKAAETA